MNPSRRPRLPGDENAIRDLTRDAERHIAFLRMERDDGRLDPRVAAELIATFDSLATALVDARAQAARLKNTAVAGSYIV